jgi:hypothetical protein
MKPWCIETETFTLDIRTVCPLMTHALIWSESEELMCIDDRINCTLDETCTIRILYTDDVLSLIVVCPEITIECRTE